MRKKILAGNWKMNLNNYEANNLAKEILVNSQKKEKIDIVLIPSYIYLSNVVSLCVNRPDIFVGSQDCSAYASGAYTSEVSANMLRNIGIKYVLLGHSERRSYSFETNEKILQKIHQVINNKMNVIFCCGESIDHRNENKHFDWIEKQIKETIFYLSAEKIKNVIIAYEPIWAIGTGNTATSSQAQEMHAFIRNLIKSKYGEFIAKSISILYGGSCNPSNAHDLFSKNDIDGGLIGGASLKSDDFIQILASFK